jgi:hypothetical protein
LLWFKFSSSWKCFICSNHCFVNWIIENKDRCTGWNIIGFGYLIVFTKFPQKVGIEQKISSLFDMWIPFRWFKIRET